MANLSSVRLTRRTVLAALSIGAAGFAHGFTPACAAQDDRDAATQLLLDAAETMSKVQSFRFELKTVRGESTILDNLELAGVVGSVQRPDSFQATITARVAIVEIDVDVIGIGSRVWVTDPMAANEQYFEVTSGDPALGEQLTSLLNPDKLLLQAVGLVKEPEIDGVETIDKVRTTRIVGSVNLAELPQFTATPEVGPSDLLLLGEMPVTIWVDADGHVLSMEVDGPLTKDESPDVIRRLNLYDFDVPVEIVAPAS